MNNLIILDAFWDVVLKFTRFKHPTQSTNQRSDSADYKINDSAFVETFSTALYRNFSADHHQRDSIECLMDANFTVNVLQKNPTKK